MPPDIKSYIHIGVPFGIQNNVLVNRLREIILIDTSGFRIPSAERISLFLRIDRYRSCFSVFYIPGHRVFPVAVRIIFDFMASIRKDSDILRRLRTCA